MTTVLKGSTWNFQGLIRVSVPTKHISQNFHFGDLRLGQFCGVPNIRQWEKNQILSLHIRTGYFYNELSYVQLLLMIQIQILVSDLHRVHLGSYDVFWGQQVLANNSRLKRARDMGAFSLCLYCHDASIDMPHDLFGSAFDLRWPWPEVKYWHDLFKVTMLWFDAPWREEYADTLIKPLAFLVQKLFAKNDVGKNSYYGGFWSLARKQLVLAQIWWHASGRTAQELSNVVFLGLLTKIVSEIMAHFRRNI